MGLINLCNLLFDWFKSPKIRRIKNRRSMNQDWGKVQQDWQWVGKDWTKI